MHAPKALQTDALKDLLLLWPWALCPSASVLGTITIDLLVLWMLW